MGSPKKSRDQTASLNKAVVSNELHNSNLTASLSLGNAQRKSWMSSSQTPLFRKFNPPKPATTRVKSSKIREDHCLPQVSPAACVESESRVSEGPPAEVDTALLSHSPEDLPLSTDHVKSVSIPSPPPGSTHEQVSGNQSGQEPRNEVARIRQPPEQTFRETHVPIEIDSDESAEEGRQVSRMLSNKVGGASRISLKASPNVQIQVQAANAPPSNVSHKNIIQADGGPPSPPVSAGLVAPTMGTARRPSSLRIPPIRRPSLELGRTPPSGSSEAQSPSDYTVAPTPPMITSPAMSQSPAPWFGVLKRGSDGQSESESARKRHQLPTSSRAEPNFWESLNAAFKNQRQGARTDVEQLMMQCSTRINEKITSRAQYGARGDIEQPRLELLRKACRLHDYSFLMIHQLFCYSGIAALNPTASRLNADDRRSLSILNTFLAKNSDLHQEMVIWFSQFPGVSPAVKSDLSPSADLETWYRAALSTLHGISSRWAGEQGLHGICAARRFPPLISEMQNAMNVFSRVLQEVIFTAMLRNLMPTHDPRFARHEAVFQRDLQISWGLGGEVDSTGLSCAEEHYQISLSSFQAGGLSLMEGRTPTLARSNSLSRTASMDSTQVQNQGLGEILRSGPQNLSYNPQALWPRTVHLEQTVPQSPHNRRFSAQVPTSILPSNDIMDERQPMENYRSQSLSNTPQISPFFFHVLSQNPQRQANAAPPLELVPSNGHLGSSHLAGASTRGQHPPPLQFAHSRPARAQMSPVEMNTTYLDQHSLPMNASRMYTQPDFSRTQAPLQWQHYSNDTPTESRNHANSQRPNIQRVVPRQQGGSQMSSGKPRDLSPKVDTGTPERCFRYIKQVYKPIDMLSGAKTQYQQVINLTQGDSENRARQLMVKGVNTLLLYPGTLTFRVRCLRVHSKKIIRADEDWVCAEQQWPASIAILVNDIPLTIQRRSGHGKDLPVDITSLVRRGANTLSVATFNSSQTGSEQYLVGVEAIETVTYTQIKNYVQSLPLEVAKKRITSKMGNEDPDIEVLDPSIIVDLTDPFSAVIFSTPARGVSCSHDQCFDLDTFLSTRMGSGGGKNGPCPPEEFKCPICKGDARPSKIVVDDFLRLIRARLEEMDRLDVKAIKIDIDGNWVIKEEPTGANDDDDDDDDGENQGNNGSTLPTSDTAHRPSTSGLAARATSSSKAVEIIDID